MKTIIHTYPKQLALTTLTALLLLCNVHAQAPKAPAMALADEASILKILTIGGFDKLIKTLPDTLTAGVDNEGSKVGISTLRKTEIKKAIQTHYGASTMTKSLSQNVAKNTTAADVQSTMTWIATPMGAKVIKAEIEANALIENAHDLTQINQGLEAMKKIGMEELKNSAKAEIYKKMLQVININELNATVSANASLAGFTVITLGADPKAIAAVKDYSKQVQESLPNSLAQIQEQSLYNIAYAYRSLDLPTLEAYLQYLKQPSTLRLNQSIKDGLIQTLTQSYRGLYLELKGK